MKKIRVEDAVGMTLCHDITAMRDGFKGAAFFRGQVIKEEDVPALLDLGKRFIYVWEENAGEIHEVDAALRLAAMAPVEGAHYTKPSEGKVNLVADVRGMFRVNTALLKQVNSIEHITISALPDHYPVEVGSKLNGARIIPLVTKEANIIAAEELCKGKKLFDLRPYKQMKVGVIITGSEIYSGRIQDKFEAICRAKLEKYPSEILGVAICDDDLDMICTNAQAFIDQGADIVIFSGGMSVDPDDLTPTAIRTLADDFITYGVPSQPGNMTLIAYQKDTALLGVPGASITQPTTMFDVVLPQLFTGDRFTKDELLNLAEGGLCQGCKPCTFPNCTFGRY